ncbi:MAG: hypothetical protein KAQ98_05295 [Bacteriovoracaceae bacterium]|nr:hypothetical protein [Bacteriovoracaceae bacterium]
MKPTLIAVLLMLSGFSVFAEDQATYEKNLFNMFTTNICHEPLKAICADTLKIREKRAKKIKLMKEEIAELAKPNIQARVAKLPNPDDYFIFRRLFYTIYNSIQTSIIINQEVVKIAHKKYGNIDLNIMTPALEDRVKDFIYRSINESSIDESSKITFKNIIHEVELLTYGEFIEKIGMDENSIALQSPCGPSTLQNNAFAWTQENKKYVLVCPGWLISNGNIANEKERFHNVLMVLAHEMSHHIDSREYPKAYSGIKNCYKKHYASDLKPQGKDRRSCRWFPKSCPEKVVSSHLFELVADSWAFNVLDLHMKDENMGYLSGKKMIQTSMMKLCGSIDEGIHPSGDFRMEKMLTRHPGIRSNLGCSAHLGDSRPACNIK